MADFEKIIEAAKAELLPFESWERLPGETSSAFAAFGEYRDSGPGRTIKKAVDGYCKKQGVDPVLAGKRYRAWRAWSMQFKWRERAADYDRYLDRLKQAELRKLIEARGEVHRQVTDKMLQVVSKKLDLMDPADLAQGTVTAWVETAIRTEREMAGLTNGKESRMEPKQDELPFANEFEGL
ncbi:hypothetical protein TREPR_2086 [Treponema primitia ZAS-2]|uniref:Uncharacterized protein n=1 Tax=Treponema primitia (strain ATCC BAA-887 / DSM 12427 / ZAS-2) TaxID=545694 RepID=F5YJQ3_TREPZ|nr:hypothetical protein [Treponema primitia]AEF84126.1 hypothetical protein TREPR_2086 [Treponema primitia ZAS-2]